MKSVLEYNLKFDIPDDVGLQFSGRGKTREILTRDVPKILDSIFLKVESEKKKTGQQTVYLRLKGFASKHVLMALTAEIARRADIPNFYYTEPYGLVSVIFEGEKDE